MNDMVNKANQASTIEIKQELPFRQLQHTFIPKSILDQNRIEKWINEILKEACINDKQNSLKKLGLDRNSLKSAGIKDEDASRLYRSMFVYTVGFYEMLGDILKNFELTAMIWQVFGILLEYVTKGDFQFTINKIYKEGQQKIEELNERLIQREQKFMSIEIQAQDQINHLQNILQDLNNQYNILKQQKDNVEQDFQQSNIAFEDAVTLKIQFQSKIIEITSIYRELAQNYSQLSEEFKELRALYDKNSDDLIMSKKHLETIIAEMDIRDNQITNLNQTIEHKGRLLDQKENKIQTLELKITQQRKNYVLDQNTCIDYEYQFNLLNVQFSKYKEENIQKLQEFQRLQIIYGDTLELNKKLTNENQAIKQEIYKLQNENKHLKIVSAELENLEQGYKSSILQLQDDLRSLIEEYEDKIKKFQTNQVEYQFGIQRIQVQQDEILAFNQVIQQMKMNKIHLNEIIIQDQAEIQQLQNGLEEKEQIITDLENSQSKLRQDFTATEISYSNKIEELQETIDSQKQVVIDQREEFEILKNQFQSQCQELIKFKSLYNELVLENHCLVKRQKHSDSVISNEKNKISELGNKITSIQIKHTEFLQGYKTLEIQFDEFKNQIYKDIQLLKDQYTNSLNYYKNMQKDMVHKLILEDALSLIDRTDQKPITFNQSYTHIDEQRCVLQNQNLQLNQEIEELNTNLQQQINLMQKLQSDYYNSSNRLKIVKFKQLVYFASLKDVTKELKLKSDTLIQIQNSNEELKIELKRLKEENINQKQLISRQKVSKQGQNEQIEDQASTNDFQDFRSSKQQIDQNQILQNSSDDFFGYFNCQVMLQNENKNSQHQIQIKDKTFQQKQGNQKFKLQQLFKSVDLLESQGENQSCRQTRKLQDFQVQDSVHDNTFEKINKDSFSQSRSISVSQATKSQKDSQSKRRMDFKIRDKNSTLIKNAKMNSKQFSQLFQITRSRNQS